MKSAPESPCMESAAGQGGQRGERSALKGALVECRTRATRQVPGADGLFAARAGFLVAQVAAVALVAFTLAVAATPATASPRHINCFSISQITSWRVSPCVTGGSCLSLWPPFWLCRW